LKEKELCDNILSMVNITNIEKIMRKL